MGRVSNAKQRLMDAVLALIWQGSYGSTTVDHICEKAGVNKGSFYYFFKDKSDLAAAATELSWQERKPELDAIFSPTVPPLERIRNFCETGYRKQVDLKKECGCVLGCPLYTLGSEVCHQESELHQKVKDILGRYQSYIQSAILEAHAQGLIHAPDSAAKARMIFAYCQGLMTQARILNDTHLLREMADGCMEILGASLSRSAA
jgi:TetR/AcrR family transcriptional repressor of nem operon